MIGVQIGRWNIDSWCICICIYIYIYLAILSVSLSVCVSISFRRCYIFWRWFDLFWVLVKDIKRYGDIMLCERKDIDVDIKIWNSGCSSLVLHPILSPVLLCKSNLSNYLFERASIFNYYTTDFQKINLKYIISTQPSAGPGCPPVNRYTSWCVLWCVLT